MQQRNIPTPAAVRSAIDRGVNFLRQRQLAWGEFASRRCTDPGLKSAGRPDSSPFTTTFVLHALDFLPHPCIEAMRQRAVTFLREERQEPGLWRYWSSRQGTSIDPDLDDTCCASFALRSQSLATGLPDSNHDCILNNRHPSGLFKTWLRGGEADNDVDGAVNANVLLYLGERTETRAALEIVAKAINEDREALASWYYPDALALYYMVSRAYYHGVTGFGICRDAILRKVRARQSNGDEAALPVALALCTLANFGAAAGTDTERAVEMLVACQAADGAWARCAFYAGPEPPMPHSVWFGSEELTTAFTLEALARVIHCTC
jgi:hypothetical protein